MGGPVKGFARLVPLAIVLALLPGASAGAEDPTPDPYHTTFANIIGVIGAGGAEWYVSYPTSVPGPGTYHVAVTASTTAAATTSLALTAGSFQGSGCTIGAFTADAAATSQASGHFPVTVSGAHCFGSVRLSITSGATTITAVRASFQIAQDTTEIRDDANGWNLDFPGSVSDPNVLWFALLAFWLFVFVGAMVMGWWIVVGMTIPFFPYVLNSAWPFNLAWFLPFLLLSLLIEWSSNRFRLEKDTGSGRYRVRRKKPGEQP